MTLPINAKKEPWLVPQFNTSCLCFVSNTWPCQPFCSLSVLSSDLYSFATRLLRSHFITSLRDYLGPILSHTYFHTKVIEARSEIYQSIDFHPFGAKITSLIASMSGLRFNDARGLGVFGWWPDLPPVIPIKQPHTAQPRLGQTRLNLLGERVTEMRPQISCRAMVTDADVATIWHGKPNLTKWRLILTSRDSTRLVDLFFFEPYVFQNGKEISARSWINLITGKHFISRDAMAMS